MKMKWIAILLALYMFLMGGCKQLTVGISTGEITVRMESANTQGDVIASFTAGVGSYDSKAMVQPWEVAKDTATGAVGTVAHVGGLLGLLPSG